MRITNKLRDLLVSKAIENSPLNKKEAELEKLISEQADVIRLEVIGGKETEKAIIRFFKNSEKMLESFPIRVGGIFSPYGSHITINYQGRYHPIDLGEPTKIIPFNKVVISSANEAMDRYENLLTQRDECRASIIALESNIYAVLKSVTTIKQLLKVWPDAKDLLPDPKSKESTLPAIPIKELNKQLGLPLDTPNAA